MAGNTISITFKLEGDEQSFKQLTKNTDGLKKAMTGAVKEASQLKSSLINWSQAIQAMDAVTNAITNVTGALGDFGEKMKGVQQANISITQLTGKTGDEMTRLRNSIQAVSDHFDTDFNETLRAANALSKGFGISIEEAMKLVRDGLVSGANAGGDFIDTVREYPRYFKEAGLSAEDFIAITTNAAQQGVFSDKGVDVIKEGNLRIREMTTATAEALDNIGISAEEVQSKLQAGSITTFEVMQQVAAKLNELPASSAAVGTAIADIFGGPGEDAGLEYIKTLANVQLSMDAVKAATHGTAEQQERQIQTQENLKNSLWGLIDLSGIITDIKPYIDLTAQVGMAAVGITSLATTLKGLGAGLLLTKIRTLAVNLTMVALGAKGKSAAVVIRVLSAALKTGAYSATAMKIALRGLMMATGIGIAIAAITTIIEHLVNATDEAAQSTNKLIDAQERAKKDAEKLEELRQEETTTLVQQRAALTANINKLREFNGTREQEKKLVGEMNTAYGESMGYFSSVSDWYKALTANSETYCRQMVLEARTRRLVNMIAEKEQEKHDLIYDEAGNKRKYSTVRHVEQYISGYYTPTSGGGGGGPQPQYSQREIPGTSDLDKANAAIEACNNSITSLNEQLRHVTEEVSGLDFNVKGSDKEPIFTPTADPKGNNLTWKEDAATLQDISNNIRILQQRLQTASAEEAATINQQIDAWNEKADVIRNAGRAVKNNTLLWKEDASTLKDINTNIQILQERLQTASAEEAATINQQIDAWNEKADAIKNAGKAIANNDPVYKANATTLKEITDNVSVLNARLQDASISEAAAINQEIKAWNEKADAIRKAGIEAEKTGEKNWEAFTSGWNAAKGLESSIAGITDALKGNGNAWQTVCGIIDGFIGLYNGIQTIIGIIQMLTAASAAHAATKGVEAGAEATEAGVRAAAATTNAATSAATIVANKLEAASFKELAAAEYMAAHAYIPFAGFGIAAGFTAAMIATVTAAGIPMLANGGLATGPTLAMVGEYAGASGNPEVIAPLDKLRSLLPDQQEAGIGNLEFRIKGDDLVAVYNRRTNKVRRS